MRSLTQSNPLSRRWTKRLSILSRTNTHTHDGNYLIILQMAQLAAIVASEIAGIHTVLAVCGVVDPDNRNLIRTGEGLTSIADFGVFDSDRDVVDMEKRLSSRTINDGRVNLGTVHIKKIWALVWWINDRQKFGQDLDPAKFDQATMLAAM